MQNKIATKEQSTLQAFEADEVWVVTTGKDSFEMTGKQAQALREATTAGQRGLVWFDGFAVSIAHIISMKRTKRGEKSVAQLAELAKERFGVPD